MAASVAMSKYCNKNIKTTSVEEILLLEGTIQNKFSKSRKFLKEVFVVEWCYSWTIAFAVFSNYSNDFETYDSMILYLIISNLIKLFVYGVNLNTKTEVNFKLNQHVR